MSRTDPRDALRDALRIVHNGGPSAWQTIFLEANNKFEDNGQTLKSKLKHNCGELRYDAIQYDELFFNVRSNADIHQVSLVYRTGPKNKKWTKVILWCIYVRAMSSGSTRYGSCRPWVLWSSTLTTTSWECQTCFERERERAYFPHSNNTWTSTQQKYKIRRVARKALGPSKLATHRERPASRTRPTSPYHQPSIYLSACLSIRPSVRSFIYSFIYFIIRLFIYSFI